MIALGQASGEAGAIKRGFELIKDRHHTAGFGIERARHIVQRRPQRPQTSGSGHAIVRERQDPAAGIGGITTAADQTRRLQRAGDLADRGLTDAKSPGKLGTAHWAGAIQLVHHAEPALLKGFAQIGVNRIGLAVDPVGQAAQTRTQGGTAGGSGIIRR